MQTVTVICEEDLIDAANELAAVLGESLEDKKTFRQPSWTDGIKDYSAASFQASEEWIMSAKQVLQRPMWDIEELIDIEEAAQAQAQLVVWDVNEDVPENFASAKLKAIIGIEGRQVLSLLNLNSIEES